MSIQSEIDRIKDNVADAYAAIEEKGGTVPAEPNSGNLAEAIRSVPSGGSSGGGSPTTLGQFPEGSIVFLNENNKPVPFYVVKHDYEPELNGPGRTLVLRANVNADGEFGPDTSEYAGSTIDTWFNTTYKNMLDSYVKNEIGVTSFYYTSVDNNYNVEVLQRSVFTPSVEEYGIRDGDTYCEIEGSAFPLPKFLVLPVRDDNNNYRDELRATWMRTPRNTGKNKAAAIRANDNGDYNYYTVSANYYYYRPCFTLPEDFVPYP